MHAAGDTEVRAKPKFYKSIITKKKSLFGIGWINNFLSWEAFQPLSKISYIMYLTHLSIQQIISQSFTYTFTYTHFIAVVYFFAELIITIVVSGVISVVIEHPWLNLEKLLVQWTVGGCQSKAKKEVDEYKNIPEKNETTKC